MFELFTNLQSKSFDKEENGNKLSTIDVTGEFFFILFKFKKLDLDLAFSEIFPLLSVLLEFDSSFNFLIFFLKYGKFFDFCFIFLLSLLDEITWFLIFELIKFVQEFFG